MQRRTLLRTTAGICGAAACSSMAGCTGLTWVPNTVESGRIVFDSAGFGEQRCIGIDNRRLASPIVVCRLDDGSLSAVSAVCTHKQCELRESAGRLECPCHGSEFALTGEVLSKPARTDLKRYSVVELDGRVMVGG